MSRPAVAAKTSPSPEMRIGTRWPTMIAMDYRGVDPGGEPQIVRGERKASDTTGHPASVTSPSTGSRVGDVTFNWFD